MLRRGEIVPVVSISGPVATEKPICEDLGELVHHLASDDAAFQRRRDGQAHVEPLGGEPPLQLGAFQRSCVPRSPR